MKNCLEKDERIDEDANSLCYLREILLVDVLRVANSLKNYRLSGMNQIIAFSAAFNIVLLSYKLSGDNKTTNADLMTRLTSSVPHSGMSSPEQWPL